jgi:hypothetical protein
VETGFWWWGRRRGMAQQEKTHDREQ